MSTPRSLILGVDGGGSTTRAWLAVEQDQQLRVIGRGESDSSNPTSRGIDAACNAIRTAVANALIDGEVDGNVDGTRGNGHFAAAALGLAGVGDESIRRRMSDWARENLSERSTVVTDAELVLHAVSESGDGVALIAGTGSFALARQGEHMVRCGGWGRLLGDEGGGYALALDALKRVARELDGRVEVSPLSDTALGHFGIGDPLSLRSAIYEATPAEIARFAPAVIELAERRDAAAQEIVEEHAGALVALVATVHQQAALLDDAPFGFTGGMLLNNEPYRRRVESALRTLLPELKPTPVEHPVMGALSLARRSLL